MSPSGMDSRTTIVARDGVSIGAGLAIAGAWTATSAIIIFFLLVVFVWSPSLHPTKLDQNTILLLLVAIVAPMIAAFSVTKVILNKDD